MKIPDINILIYAVNRDTPHHGKARDWLETALSSRDTVGFAWIVLLGFLRIVTNDRIMPKPLSLDTATGLIDEWLDLPVSQVISPMERHWEIVKELLLPLQEHTTLAHEQQGRQMRWVRLHPLHQLRAVVHIHHALDLRASPRHHPHHLGLVPLLHCHILRLRCLRRHRYDCDSLEPLGRYHAGL